MKITQWPLAERPREKLLMHGVKSLADAELIAILLQFGTKGKTALDLARELLHQFGSLKKLLHTPPQFLCQLSGLGRAKYAILKAALEIGQRCTEETVQVGEKLRHSQTTQQFLATQLRDEPREIFACLFLNHHNRIIAFEKLFHGTLSESPVYPREIVKRGLTHNAAKIILSHNHPSGNPAPSQADKDITHYIKQALALVDIKIIDHIIVGTEGNFSFAEAGWI